MDSDSKLIRFLNSMIETKQTRALQAEKKHSVSAITMFNIQDLLFTKTRDISNKSEYKSSIESEEYDLYPKFKPKKHISRKLG